ncbi:LPS assembly protein LptD [Magnetovibrio sp. PR-2]|uniref:LPS-assembly protein LptD n=1 Tax=Magnetovibrio sp. PR-2 TaxID=3120356 RepID=UPI002FCE1772
MLVKSTYLISALCAALVYCGVSLSAALAQAPAQEEQPARFVADEMSHDQELGIIIATGHVEVNQNDRTLLADAINYNQNTDTITATGNVALHQPSGDILFADKFEITGDLKNGVIEDLMAVMADQSRFAAQRAQLVNDETMTMERAVYSPCEQCKEDPGRPLVWQLKAVKIVHDRTEKVITYRHAWMEVFGFPVAYTPYLSYPDPSVKRKSGFLTPNWGGSSDLGFVARTPYFYVMDDHSDLTVTPIMTSQELGALAGEYRHRFMDGSIDAFASVAYDSDGTAHGHIESETRFELDDTWRWGLDLNGSSTDTYMRRYGFGGHNTLTSKAYIEGFRGNNYGSLSTVTYQGLRADDDQKTTPLVMPILEYAHQGEADKYGAYNTLDVHMSSITRSEGVDSNRITIRPSWNLQHIAPKGDIYKLSATMGLDFFNTSELSAPANRSNATNGSSTYNGSALRAYPELSMDWRWPFAKRTNSVTEVIEPIAQFVVSPYGGNSWKMSNEDSQDFDFNDANLFSANRFTGYDRVESGPRVNYGMKWGLVGDGGGFTSVLVGQSYRLAEDDTFATNSGLEDNFSDLVGRLEVSPGDHLSLLYRTRMDRSSLEFHRNEIGLNGQVSGFNYDVNYSMFDRHDDSEFSGRQEISYNLTQELSEFWKGRLAGVRDLTDDGGPRSNTLGFTYEDECLTFDTTLQRTYYQDREIKPTDSIMFRVVFKTLGEVRTDVSPGF